MIKIRANKVLPLSLSLILLISIIYFLIHDYSRMFRQAIEMPVNRGWPDPEYLNVFQPKESSKLRHYETSLIEKRDPVSIYKYDNDFFIVQTKIHLQNRTSLKNIVEIEKGSVDGSNYVYYSKYDLSELTLNVRMGSNQAISRIFLATDDPSLKTVKLDDRMACYYLESGRFSIRYGKDSTIDIYNSGPEGSIFSDSHTQPALLMFLEKDDDVYLILAGTNNEKAILRKELLITLVKV